MHDATKRCRYCGRTHLTQTAALACRRRTERRWARALVACPTCGGQVQRMADGRLIRHFDMRGRPAWCQDPRAQVSK